MNTKGKISTAVLLLAVLAVALAATNTYMSIQKSSGIQEQYTTGYAGTTGEVNITVVTVLDVNFTYDFVNWSAGTIQGGQTNASLSTTGAANKAPNVTRGNWTTTQVNPLILRNMGTINASILLAGGENAATLLAGSAGNRKYAFNVTNNMSGSCNGANENRTIWRDIDTTGERFCSQFGYLADHNEVRVDVWLVIPYNGNTGSLTDTITATASTAI